MNPSPDRNKECLPPKKRESRQGSSDLPLHEFKPPVPLRSRSNAGRGEGGTDLSDKHRALSTPNTHLLHTPPPLPAPAPLPAPTPLPWHLNYNSSVSLPIFQGHPGERRGPGSPAWRDDTFPSPLSLTSRWLRGEGPLSFPSPSSSSTSFKTPFPADSRDMWSYISSGRRDYTPSHFSPSYFLGHTSLYSQDQGLVESGHRYLGKRPNGLDGPGSRTASSTRPLVPDKYGSDSIRTRLDSSPHSNGARRHQEDLTPRVPSGGTFLSDSQAQEAPQTHSSQQNRHHGLLKMCSSQLPSVLPPTGTDARVSSGDLLDPTGTPSAEAHIYYSLGSVEPPNPRIHAYPPYCPSGTSPYNVQMESGPRLQRNSPQSPLSQRNSQSRSQRERDQRQDIVLQRERERGKEKNLKQYKDHSSPPALDLSPPALLPNFTKGSLIELASGRLKRVEELKTEDFLRSADTSPEFHLSTCTVLLISASSAQGFSHLQVHLTDRNTQELLKVLVEYPFFVQHKGWSSCSPQRTSQLYGLPCRQLAEGDVCLVLTPTPNPSHRTHARSGSRAHRTQPRTAAESSRAEMPPPPPPPPLPSNPPATVPTTAADPQEILSRPRKRRWSAPDSLPPTHESLLDLPHGSKLMKWQ
ncbi:uncharacterized protein ACB058_018623 isoform 1-T2 [Synchiropus picturatus]